jgi:cytochrome c-type biogenesis protein CcmH
MTDQTYCSEIKNEDKNYELFISITKELRCIESPNQSLFESDIAKAVNIKNSIIKMINEGKDKNEILTILKNRYGQYIDFNPNINRNIFLWLEPFLIITVCLILIIKQTKLK